MKLNITKLDAATRQLDTAITLWFQDGDAVSTHTLASASHQILHDIVKKERGPDMIFNSLLFKEEYRSKVNKSLRAPQNFFKHADEDSDLASNIEFNTELTESFMMMSLIGLEFLKTPLNDLRGCFFHWFALHHPDSLTAKGKDQYTSSGLFEGVKNFTSKLEFFRIYRIAYQQHNKSKE